MFRALILLGRGQRAAAHTAAVAAAAYGRSGPRAAAQGSSAKRASTPKRVLPARGRGAQEKYPGAKSGLTTSVRVSVKKNGQPGSVRSPTNKSRATGKKSKGGKQRRASPKKAVGSKKPSTKTRAVALRELKAEKAFREMIKKAQAQKNKIISDALRKVKVKYLEQSARERTYSKNKEAAQKELRKIQAEREIQARSVDHHAAPPARSAATPLAKSSSRPAKTPAKHLSASLEEKRKKEMQAEKEFKALLDQLSSRRAVSVAAAAAAAAKKQTRLEEPQPESATVDESDVESDNPIAKVSAVVAKKNMRKASLSRPSPPLPVVADTPVMPSPSVYAEMLRREMEQSIMAPAVTIPHQVATPTPAAVTVSRAPLVAVDNSAGLFRL